MWGDELTSQSNWISLKVGMEAEFTIKEIKKITTNPDFHFKKKNGENLGYHYEFLTDKGTLTVGSFGLFFALKGVGADVGHKVKVTHPARGKYTAVITGGQAEVKEETPPPEEELAF